MIRPGFTCRLSATQMGCPARGPTRPPDRSAASLKKARVRSNSKPPVSSGRSGNSSSGVLRWNCTQDMMQS